MKKISQFLLNKEEIINLIEKYDSGIGVKERDSYIYGEFSRKIRKRGRLYDGLDTKIS